MDKQKDLGKWQESLHVNHYACNVDKVGLSDHIYYEHGSDGFGSSAIQLATLHTALHLEGKGHLEGEGR